MDSWESSKFNFIFQSIVKSIGNDKYFGEVSSSGFSDSGELGEDIKLKLIGKFNLISELFLEVLKTENDDTLRDEIIMFSNEINSLEEFRNFNLKSLEFQVVINYYLVICFIYLGDFKKAKQHFRIVIRLLETKYINSISRSKIRKFTNFIRKNEMRVYRPIPIQIVIVFSGTDQSIELNEIANLKSCLEKIQNDSIVIKFVDAIKYSNFHELVLELKNPIDHLIFIGHGNSIEGFNLKFSIGSEPLRIKIDELKNEIFSTFSNTDLFMLLCCNGGYYFANEKHGRKVITNENGLSYFVVKNYLCGFYAVYKRHLGVNNSHRMGRNMQLLFNDNFKYLKVNYIKE